MDRSKNLSIQELLKTFELEENKNFIKLSAPGAGAGSAPPLPPLPPVPPVPAPGSTGAPPTPTAEELEKKLRQEKKEADELEREKREQTRKTKEIVDPAFKIVDKQGQLADEFSKLKKSRATLIYKLQALLPEERIADYFNEFLFVHKIPESTMLDLMNEAVEAAQNGATIVNVLDFALLSYANNRNFERTKSVIDTATKLQPEIRQIDLFQLLSDYAQGKPTGALNFIMLGKDNMNKVVLVNQLLSLALYRGKQEDIEELIIQLQKDTDALRRQDEIFDATVGIFNVLLTSEFRKALARITEFSAEQFKLAVNSSEYRRIRRILTMLKLGSELRKRALSDIEQKKIVDDKTKTSNNTSSFVKLSQVQSGESAKKSAAIYIVKSIYDGLDNLSNILSDSLRSNLTADERTKINSLIVRISQSRQIFSNLIQKIKDPSYKISNFTSDYNSILNLFSDFNNPSLDKQLSAKSNDKKFIKTSQNIELPTFQEIFKTILQIKTTQTLLAIGLNIKSLYAAASVYMFKLLWDKASQRETEIERVGLGSPVKTASPSDLIQNTRNIYSLLNNLQSFKNSADQATAFQIALEKIKTTTELQEELFLNKLNTDVVDNISGSISSVSAPFALPAEIKQEHEKLLRVFRTCLSYHKAFKIWINRFIEEAKARTDLMNLAMKAQVDAFEKSLDRDISDLEKKERKYRSIVNIIQQLQSIRKLYRDISAKFPQLETYLAIGFTVVDLMRVPGGLRSKLDQIYEQIRSARDQVYNDYIIAKNRREQYEKQKIEKARTTTPALPPNRTTSPTPAAPTTPSSGTTMQANKQIENVKISELLLPDKLANIYTDNFKFNNIFFEKNIKISQNTNRVKYYEDKINLNKNLYLLKNQISDQIKSSLLSQNEVNTLISKIDQKMNDKLKSYIDKLKSNKVDLNALKNYLTSEKNNFIPDDYKKLLSIIISAKDPNSKFSVDKKNNNLASLDYRVILDQYSFDIPNINEYGIEEQLPDILERMRTEGFQGIDPTSAETDQAILDSLKSDEGALEQQLIQQEKELNDFERYMTLLLVNPPSNLSDLRSKISNNKDKFIKIAKSNDDIDEEFRAYWDEYYGIPWGTIVEEKPEHSSKSIEEEVELHKERMPKFKKINPSV